MKSLFLFLIVTAMTVAFSAIADEKAEGSESSLSSDTKEIPSGSDSMATLVKVSLPKSEREIKEISPAKPIRIPLFELKAGVGYYLHEGIGSSFVLKKTIIFGFGDKFFQSGFRLDPGLNFQIYYDLKDNKIDYLDSGISGLSLISNKGVKTLSSCEMLAFSVNFRYILHPEVISIIGGDLSVIDVNGQLSLPGGWGFDANVSIARLLYGKIEILDRDFHYMGEFFNVNIGLRKDIKIAVLRGAFSVLLKSKKNISTNRDGVDEWMENHEDDKYAPAGIIYQTVLGGRFSMENIGGSPLGLFYKYDFIHFYHSDWYQIGDEGVSMQHFHLVGLQLRN